VWAADFMHDSLFDGRRFHALTVIDEWTRECLATAVDVSVPGERVVRVLKRLCETRGVPAVLQSDNGPEFRGWVMDQWAHGRGVRLHFIELGKPIQNAFIESFNSRLASNASTSRPCSRMRGARSNCGGCNTIANGHIGVSATWRPKSSRHGTDN
jgi:putative transposase